MEEDGLRAQLRNAIKSRAMIYHAVYEVLADELGAARAEEMLKRAIYRRGCAVGARFQEFAPGDFAGLARAFLDFVPDHGRMFEPEVTRCDEGGLDIKFHACPLKDAWIETGLDDGAVETLRRIAGSVDNGTFETAGFALQSQTWKPGDAGCCLLHIRSPR